MELAPTRKSLDGLVEEELSEKQREEGLIVEDAIKIEERERFEGD